MERREVGFVLFFLFETLKPSIECALFDLKVLILFLVIARVITAGMKMSFAPGFDKSVGVDGGFGGIVTEQKSFGGSTLLKDGVDVQGDKMLIDDMERWDFLDDNENGPRRLLLCIFSYRWFALDDNLVAFLRGGDRFCCRD